MSKKIKTSKHTIHFANKQKKENLSSFVNEYRRTALLVIDHIWENGYEWEDKKGEHRFSIQDNLLHFPIMMKGEIISNLNIKTFLTARALKCMLTQAAGIISAETEKQRKRLFMFDKQKENNKKAQCKHLIKKIKQNIPQKPDIIKINPELNSICCDWQETKKGKFDGYLRLKSITKTKMEIKLPIKFHRQSHKLAKTRKQMNSYLISKTKVDFRWQKEEGKQKKQGKVIGCDQGMKDVLACSDKQVTPKSCLHGHSLQTIISKLSKKKRGSHAFKKAQDHRKNFINWSLNQLNLKGIRELRLERIWNIRYKNRTNRIMSHWTNTLIRDKVEDMCEEEGIRLIHQSSTYRSQRCSSCGVVRKANRKGKVYSCKHCSLEIDSDLNASLNHEINLPKIPYSLRKLKKNRGNGFYWLKTGFYDFETSRSLQSLLPVKG